MLLWVRFFIVSGPLSVLLFFSQIIMLEAILSAAILVGSVQVGPNVLAEQYIVDADSVPVLIEVLEEME